MTTEISPINRPTVTLAVDDDVAELGPWSMIGEMLVNGEGRPLTVLLGFGKWGRQIKPGPDWTRANLVAGQRPERPTKYKGIHQRPDGTWVAYYNRKSKGPFETEGEAIAARKALVAAGSKPR